MLTDLQSISRQEAKNGSALQKLYNTMKANRARGGKNLAPDYKHHMERLKEGNYAFMADILSVKNDMEAMRVCDLYILDEVAYFTYYSIGLQHRSPYRKLVTDV